LTGSAHNCPAIEASIPQGIKTEVVVDRTTTIRASVSDVERTLILSVVLVILVVFVFLRDWRATLIPIVAVPASLIGTFAVMYLFGFSIDKSIAHGTDHLYGVRRR
jgi:multidrug efflux pump